MRDAQQARILELLMTVNDWVPLPAILDLRIASYTRRITDLRKMGFDIRCEKEWVEGVCHSRYKLFPKTKQLELIG